MEYRFSSYKFDVKIKKLSSSKTFEMYPLSMPMASFLLSWNGTIHEILNQAESYLYIIFRTIIFQFYAKFQYVDEEIRHYKESHAAYAALISQVLQTFISITSNSYLSFGFRYEGDTSLILLGTALHVQNFAFTPSKGMSQEFQPVAGINYSAKQYEKTLKLTKALVLRAIVLSLCFLLPIQIAPDKILSLFIRDANMQQILKKLSYTLKNYSIYDTLIERAIRNNLDIHSYVACVLTQIQNQPANINGQALLPYAKKLPDTIRIKQ